MAYKITDNYLKQEHYQNLKALITDNDFPWRRRWNMYKDGHPSNKGFFTLVPKNFILIKKITKSDHKNLHQ